MMMIHFLWHYDTIIYYQVLRLLESPCAKYAAHAGAKEIVVPRSNVNIKIQALHCMELAHSCRHLVCHQSCKEKISELFLYYTMLLHRTRLTSLQLQKMFLISYIVMQCVALFACILCTWKNNADWLFIQYHISARMLHKFNTFFIALKIFVIFRKTLGEGAIFKDYK